MSEWIVCYKGHPVRFTINHQRVWSIVHIDDASTFETQDDALVALHDWGLHGNGRFSIRRKILPEPVTKN